MAETTTREIGIIMNGVSGRMGYRQHLVRSILAIRDQGGIELPDGTRVTVKPILVGGSYLDLMKRWNKQVFYDQDGTLVRKFGITAVPAIVSQEGRRLRIDEVPVS